MEPVESMNADVAAYIDSIPALRRAHVDALHAAILECFPAATIDMRYKMPTYSDGEGWVALANQKRYVSLYTCNAAHLARFKQQHPGIKTGKGCINFRDKDVIPVADVKAVICDAIRYPKANFG